MLMGAAKGVLKLCFAMAISMLNLNAALTMLVNLYGNNLFVAENEIVKINKGYR